MSFVFWGKSKPEEKKFIVMVQYLSLGEEGAMFGVIQTVWNQDRLLDEVIAQHAEHLKENCYLDVVSVTIDELNNGSEFVPGDGGVC